MFGSPALETAIGLAAMFFLLATAASGMTEALSRFTNKRARDLEQALAALSSGKKQSRKKAGRSTKPDESDLDRTLAWLRQTSVWKSATGAAGLTLLRRKPKRPEYLSAAQFADAVTELLTTHAPNGKEGTAPARRTVTGGGKPWPDNIQDRLDALVAEGHQDLISIKAGLESWFDEAMARAAGSYKRWATLILFVTGLVLAIGLNLSTISTARALWQDPMQRAAVETASAKLLADGATATQIDSLTEAQPQINDLGLPGGWSADAKARWYLTDPGDGDRGSSLARLSDMAGWLLTALLVMLGAPFWFDVMGRLVSLRSTGAKPSTAGKDAASATSASAAPRSAMPQATQVVATSMGPSFAEKVGLVEAATAPRTPGSGKAWLAAHWFGW